MSKPLSSRMSTMCYDPLVHTLGSVLSCYPSYEIILGKHYSSSRYWLKLISVKIINYSKDSNSIRCMIVILGARIMYFLAYTFVSRHLCHHGQYENDRMVGTDLGLSSGWGGSTTPVGPLFSCWIRGCLAVPWISCWILTFLGGLATELINAIFTCRPGSGRKREEITF